MLRDPDFRNTCPKYENFTVCALYLPRIGSSDSKATGNAFKRWGQQLAKIMKAKLKLSRAQTVKFSYFGQVFLMQSTTIKLCYSVRRLKAMDMAKPWSTSHASL